MTELMVNGATGQATHNETQLVAIIAYNQFGGGNGIVVHKDSPYYDLADLKGKNVSVRSAPPLTAKHECLFTSWEKPIGLEAPVGCDIHCRADHKPGEKWEEIPNVAPFAWRNYRTVSWRA